MAPSEAAAPQGKHKKMVVVLKQEIIAVRSDEARQGGTRKCVNCIAFVARLFSVTDRSDHRMIHWPNAS